MSRTLRFASTLLFTLTLGCAASSTRRPGAPVGAVLLPDEKPFLADLRQLTAGGENAEAYWSFDGTELSFQARRPGEGCDRIYRMRPDGSAPVPVSSGKGASTCPHFFPNGGLLYSSTHLAGPACPPRPDMSRGYVWAVYDSYDIFSVSTPDGAPRPLTKSHGYDAEATVCGRDGSIIFTSTRDGDLELYRMDRNGANVRRLTRSWGYDGGAFFNRDCSKVVWRASRPRAGRELDDYKALLAQGLVRPSKLEIWIADADGSNPMQLTYLDAASFAPSFHPTEDVILFSSNHPDPRGREFDLWAVRTDGSGLRRITSAPGFDGFPHFSPDGKRIAFSSNRATLPGRNDTNVFVARWLGLEAGAPDSAADRINRDVSWLADPAREGRGVGTKGLEDAGAFLEERLRRLGLEPAGDDGSYRHRFPIVTKVAAAPGTKVAFDRRPLPAGSVSVLGFSAQGKATAPAVLAGYGIVDEKLGRDDYKGLDVKGKIAVVRRFAPETVSDHRERLRLGDLRRKAWLARERGAIALVVVDWPEPPTPRPADWKPGEEAALLEPVPDGSGDAGIPIVMVKRAALEPVKARLESGKPVAAALDVALTFTETQAFNVIARLRAGKPGGGGAVVIGAHYDHLGSGGRGSLAPDRTDPHVGADDNASGTATVLEVARALAARRDRLTRDVVVALFSGEESGLLGSVHYTRTRPEVVRETRAMINLDMVGRLRDNRVEVLGADTADEWRPIVTGACQAERVGCQLGGDGYGASDQAAFYAAGIPVLHFFTGTHPDYHKPTDTAEKVNAAGAAAIGRVVERVVLQLQPTPRLTFKKGVVAPMRGDVRSFNASLGTIPDYAGPPAGQPGVLLSGVRAGGGAEKAGMRRGDILTRLGTHEIRSVQDLGFALSSAKPGETVTAIVIRDGKEVRLETTFQESARSRAP